jgi:uncharacterized lipoprotein YajG
MKTKFILLASILLLFSCATKSIVADTSKTTAPIEIQVVQEPINLRSTKSLNSAMTVKIIQQFLPKVGNH